MIPSGRQVRLAFTLEALARQSIDLDRFEVIVVRDGAAPVSPVDGLDLRVIHGPGDRNIAALRNLGWRTARGTLVAFTDDDCRPTPDWVRGLLAAADGPMSALQGRTEPDPDEAHLLHGLARSQRITELSPWLETCNMAYPRSLLERLDGFDEDFGQLGEDTDLGLRAIGAGASFRYLDDAVVWHAVLPQTLRGAVSQARRRDAIPRLVRRHPQQRSALYRQVFWKRSHAFLLLAAAGLATRRPAVAAISALPWLRENTDIRSLAGPRRAARQALYLAARATVDTVEVAATSAAAVRERTLVL